MMRSGGSPGDGGEAIAMLWMGTTQNVYAIGSPPRLAVCWKTLSVRCVTREAYFV